MNKLRRKQIEKLIVEINHIQFDGQKANLLDAKEALENIKDEEQGYLDNMPENLHGGDAYSNSEIAISSIVEALQLIETLIDAIEDFQNDFTLAGAVDN